MELEIRKLAPQLLDDFLYFFDHVAFADHKEWAGCFCTHFHWDSKMEALWKEGKAEGGRPLAVRLIRDGVMRGYLAYNEGAVVGWCNAGDKTTLCALADRRELWDGLEKTCRILSVVCFLTAPDFRGRGVAAALLERVCADARAEGYGCVEAYPYETAKDIFVNHHGPYALFEKQGFVPVRRFTADCLVRKYVS